MTKQLMVIKCKRIDPHERHYQTWRLEFKNPTTFDIWSALREPCPTIDTSNGVVMVYDVHGNLIYSPMSLDVIAYYKALPFTHEVYSSYEDLERSVFSICLDRKEGWEDAMLLMSMEVLNRFADYCTCIGRLGVYNGLLSSITEGTSFYAMDYKMVGYGR